MAYAFFPRKSCIFLCNISIYTIFTPRPEEKYASATPYQQSVYYDHSMPSSLYRCALHMTELFHRVHHSFYIWSQTYAENNAVKMALIQTAPASQNLQALLPAGLLLKQPILSKMLVTLLTAIKKSVKTKVFVVSVVFAVWHIVKH